MEIKKATDIDILLKNKDNKTLDEIKSMLDNNQYYFDKYEINKYKNCFFIFDPNDVQNIEYIFNKPIKIIYKNVLINNNFIDLVEDNVISSIQITETLKKYNINGEFINEDGNYIEYNDNKFNLIYLFNNFNNITFYNNNYVILKLEELKIPINIEDNEFKLEEISKNFNNYFKYYDSNLKKLKYFNSDNRKIFLQNLQKFYLNNNLHYFKISGPSDIGKSTSLLLFSRTFSNILYFNIETLLYMYQSNDKKPMISLFISELSRIFLNKNEKENLIKFFYQLLNKTPWNIIYYLMKYLQKFHILFIFDQFKIKNIDEEILNNIYKLIENENNKLQIVFCSSINENNIRNEIIKTIKKFNGNPKELNFETQYYYFYIDSLFEINFLKENYINNENIELYSLFNYSDKYIKKLISIKNQTNYTKLNHIKNHILEKINKNYGLRSIINLESYINRELIYSEENLEILKSTPLKYYSLSLNKNHFIIKYLFPFIEKISNDYINITELNDYFIKRKFNQLENQNNKGNYFERIVKEKIRETDNFLPIKIDYNLLTNKIIDFSEIENEYLNVHNYIKDNLNENDKNYFLGRKKNKDFESNEFKNGNILIDQKMINGPVIDLGFMYGQKNNKTFIGFQMKFYDRKSRMTSKDKKKFNKKEILKSLKKMNSKLDDYDIKIENFHYFFISFYDSENNYFNKSFFNDCNKKGIEHLFYDPIKKLFFDYKFEQYKNINLNEKTNLSENEINPSCIFYIKHVKLINDLSIKYLNLDEDNIFFKYLSKNICINLIKNKYLNIIKKIDFIGIYNITNGILFPLPKKGYGELIKTKDNNFILYINIKNFLYCNLITKNDITDIDYNSGIDFTLKTLDVGILKFKSNYYLHKHFTK